VFFICISRLASDVEPSFKGLLIINIYYLEKYLFKSSFGHFLWCSGSNQRPQAN
jgi:hypothetical protein